MPTLYQWKLFYSEDEARTMAYDKIRKDAVVIATRYKKTESETISL